MDNQLVPPWIPNKPLLAVVGQGPGTDEWKRQRPFIGREGQQLRSWLAGFGLDPDEDVMYSNVHDEYHPGAPAYVPSTKECKEGYARLAEEFGLVPSLRCVVLLGGPAAHLLFSGRMGEMHGRQSTLAGIPMLACYHPGFFWHSKGAKARAQAEGEILSVLRQAVDIVRGKSTEVELPKAEYVGEVVVT